MSVIGRRCTAEDYQRTAEDGWVLGAHGEEDSMQQTKDELSYRHKVTSRKPWISGQCEVLDSADRLAQVL
jgi:hypothetical protein